MIASQWALKNNQLKWQWYYYRIRNVDEVQFTRSTNTTNRLVEIDIDIGRFVQGETAYECVIA